MAHDPFGNQRYSGYGIDPAVSGGWRERGHEELDELRRRLDYAMRELEHFKERAASATGQSEYFHREQLANSKYIRVLELALFMACGTDAKKADVLAKAKTSIDVLKTFEK
jgi:hypothetical protein